MMTDSSYTSKFQAISTTEPSHATLFLSDTRILRPSMLHRNNKSLWYSNLLQADLNSSVDISSSLNSLLMARRDLTDDVRSATSCCCCCLVANMPAAVAPYTWGCAGRATKQS
eukprot:GHUV01033394.1.p1 GENE.GHUV01033394.1~~GHUV01033394.1.p1  ORF type:complete len:113 (+),score=2.26 GHUV01033394.1:81-419(+)